MGKGRACRAGLRYAGKVDRKEEGIVMLVGGEGRDDDEAMGKFVDVERVGEVMVGMLAATEDDGESERVGDQNGCSEGGG